MILGITGHRPDKILASRSLGGSLYNGYDIVVQNMIREFARKVLQAVKPSTILTGMALGWDTAMAQAAELEHIPFVAMIPFQGQEDRWSSDSKQEYNRLLKLALDVRYITDYKSKRSFLIRNEAIVKEAQLMAAFWNGEPDGGTAHCVRFANSKSVPVRNYWDAWHIFRVPSE